METFPKHRRWRIVGPNYPCLSLLRGWRPSATKYDLKTRGYHPAKYPICKAVILFRETWSTICTLALEKWCRKLTQKERQTTKTEGYVALSKVSILIWASRRKNQQTWRQVETDHIVWRTEMKQINKDKESFREMQDTFKCTDLHVMRVPEWRSERNVKKSYSKI